VRNPSDLPPRGFSFPRGPRERGSNRGRIVLSLVVGAVVALFVSARSIAGFFVDVLWHDSLGRGDVFWGVLWAKVLLALVFTLVFALLL